VTKALTQIGYVSPIVIVSALSVSYLIAPEFYLSYILEETRREEGVVEIVTFLSALIAGLILFYSTWHLFKSGNWLAAGIVGMISLVTLIFAGEEISWGQVYFQWPTPPWWRDNFGGRTELHSGTLPVSQLAAIFLLATFFLLPLAWKFRSPFRLPLELEPAIAEGPVIFTIAFAAIYREFKGIYLLFTPLEYQDRLYREFFWGLNEHKEMLIAIAILMYALYRSSHIKILHQQGF